VDMHAALFGPVNARIVGPARPVGVCRRPERAREGPERGRDVVAETRST
jgi:hypothetical protein